MQSYEITYKGENIRVEKDNATIIFPKRVGTDGKGLFETITIEPGCLVFVSKKEGTEEFLQVWLYNDRTMAHQTHNMEEPRTAPNKFNAMLDKGSLINDVCKEIYGVVRQLREYEILGYPVNTVGKLRTKEMEVALQLLGYQNSSNVKSPLEDASGYMALSRIGNQLRNYRNLAPYVYGIGQRFGTDAFVLKQPQEISKQQLKNMVQENVDQLFNNVEFLKQRDDQNERMRDILPTFCLNMKEQIDPRDWEIYAKVIEETALLYLSLNADLLPYADKVKVSNATSLEEAELKKKISKLIDSKEFARACEIEAEFVRHQVQCLKEQIDMELGESKAVRESSPGKILLRIGEEADDIYTDTKQENEKAKAQRQGVTQAD